MEHYKEGGDNVVLTIVLCLTLIVIHYSIDILKYPCLFFLSPLFCLWLSDRILFNNFFSWIGTISLEMYLIHMKLIPLFVRHGFLGIYWLVFALFLTIIFSYALHFTIEQFRVYIEKFRIRN